MAAGPSFGPEANDCGAVSTGSDTGVRRKFSAIDSIEEGLEAALSLEPPPAEFENLPAWEQPFTAVKLRPVFVIGAGGTAALVLKHLQHRWGERFDNSNEAPIFQSLLLDTDPQTLGKISSAADPACRFIQSDLLPLKKPEDYRDHGEQLMRWLGHRWIYNIPRSLHTEGLRPLGRLALIDNAERVMARIRKVLKNITAPASLEAAAKQMKTPVPEPAPLIYLVAAISGGTGSGMILDLAFAVREALAQEGITSARICGMLLHGSSRQTAEKKLAVANSYACLRELHAYGHKYPGEAAWGIPAAEEGRQPFDDTYFVHLGDDLDEAQIQRIDREDCRLYRSRHHDRLPGFLRALPHRRAGRRIGAAAGMERAEHGIEPAGIHARRHSRGRHRIAKPQSRRLLASIAVGRSAAQTCARYCITDNDRSRRGSCR